MTFIEPGLSVRDGYAEGPLADAALSRAARAALLLDDLQEQAPTLTDAQLRDRVHRALRRYTRGGLRGGVSTGSSWGCQCVRAAGLVSCTDS
ncbi:hypothetical protein [Streptomyces sp. NPDC051173]|uniref:hypothetical protein n=1 Tax=Streptomyces sp. NPDC051173 TaxID=3155164 RepID=UPI00344FBB18